VVEAGVYRTRSDAEFAQAVLASAGIASVAATDDAGGAYLFDPTGAARLLVEEEDAEKVAAILSDRLCPSRKEQP
jgi:hypothetical protein